MDMYLKIANSDGKVWILPENDLKTAMCLYQPSAIKGIVLKKYLPAFNKLGSIIYLFYKKIGIEKIPYSLDPVLEKHLTSVFGNSEDQRYAIFMGTPSVHQKITIQISRKNEIVGYCKITDSKKIYDIFCHENNMLEYLNRSKVKNIPTCLSCAGLGDGRFAFSQTTIKTLNSVTKHMFGEAEWAFLQQLNEKTVVDCMFENTDFFRSLIGLQENLSVLERNGFNVECVKSGIYKILNYYANVRNYSVCHRDFTPWNMFYENDILFVFDFEYAQYTYPKYLDAMHYFMQTAIFEKNLNGDEILQAFSQQILTTPLKDMFSDPYVALLSYILDIISLYVSRENGMFTGDVMRNMKIWMYLCSEIVERI